MNFNEAFERLEIEPTRNKKEIKIAYSKMLKKYHPEEFPEMFIKINEAYEKALKYVESILIEDVDSEEKFENFVKNNSFKYIFENTFENENTILENEKNKFYYEVFNGVYRVENLLVIEWIEKFEKLIRNKNRILSDLKKLFEEFYKNYSEEDRKSIVEILSEKEIINEIISKIFWKKENFTEKKDLNKVEIDIILFHFGIIKNHKVHEFKNDGKLKDEIIDEIFEKYFGIKVFRGFGRVLGLYEVEAEEKEMVSSGEMNFSKKLFYSFFFDQRKKISSVVELIYDLGIENEINKKDKALYSNFKKLFLIIGISIMVLCYTCLFLNMMTGGIYNYEIWIIWIIAITCFMLVDLYFVKIEKNFEWTKQSVIDVFIIFATTILYIFSSAMNFKFTYFIIILFCIIKIQMILKERYVKLKKIAIKILNGY